MSNYSKILKPAFQQTLKSLPFVFKKISLYIGIWFFLLSSLFFFLNKDFSSEQLSDILKLVYLYAPFFIVLHFFHIFMISYYSYCYNNGLNPSFWKFISNKIWPLIIAYIKAIFTVLGFMLLLVVPGLIKSVRLCFLIETVFFDKKTEVSFLKKTIQNSKGYFRISAFVIVLVSLSLMLDDILNKISPSKSILYSIFITVLYFYVRSFAILFRNQVYFQIKKEKGEEVSI